MISLTKIKQIIEEEDEGPTLDYKEDLNLQTDGDKAQFVKDVLSLANSGQTTHIIIGVEDGTRKLIGIKTTHKAEQLNDILKNKCDPPLTVEYEEKTILGHKVGIVEFSGENPPYIVAVPDRFGGPLSSDPRQLFYIERGTVFVRNFNKNEGACRADLDRMYKIKYVTLEADLQLEHSVKVKQLEDSQEALITFFLKNLGEIVAADAIVWIRFKNIKEIVNCSGLWQDISKVNNNQPTIQLVSPDPIVLRAGCKSVTVRVGKHMENIEVDSVIGATNMRTKRGAYSISLKEHHLAPKTI
jgi:hypothetical protein